MSARLAQTPEPHPEKQHFSILTLMLKQAAPNNLPSSSHPSHPHSPFNLHPSSSVTVSDLPQKLDCTCSSVFTVSPSSLLVSILPTSTSLVFPRLSASLSCCFFLSLPSTLLLSSRHPLLKASAWTLVVLLPRVLE